jgi:hypothetical protein
MLRKVATPALTVTGRQGFTTGGTEVHGVWPGCERPSPRGHGGARGLAAVRKAFTTWCTEEHGVWPRCERLSPRAARRCTGSGRAAKGLHHGGHGGARGLAAVRKAFTTGCTEEHGVWPRLRKAFTTGARRCRGLAHMAKDSASSCQSRLPVFTRPGRKSTDGC